MLGTSRIYFVRLPNRLCSSPPLLGFYWNRWGENSVASGLNAYNLQTTLIQYDYINTKIWARSRKKPCSPSSVITEHFACASRITRPDSPMRHIDTDRLLVWAGDFLPVAWPTRVQLLVFFCSSVPVMLFGTPGISGCRSQHVPVESSSLLHHSVCL